MIKKVLDRIRQEEGFAIPSNVCGEDSPVSYLNDEIANLPLEDEEKVRLIKDIYKNYRITKEHDMNHGGRIVFSFIFIGKKKNGRENS